MALPFLMRPPMAASMSDFLNPAHRGQGQVDGRFPVLCDDDRHVLVVRTPFGGCAPSLPCPAALDLFSLLRFQEEGLVALGDPGKVFPVAVAERGEDFVPPVERRLLVDIQGVLDLVEALFLHHQGKVAVDLVLFVQAGHPCTGILGKAPFAGLALVALRALVLPEPYVLAVATVRAAAHPVVQKVAARGLCLRHGRGIPDFPEEPFPVGGREHEDLSFDFCYIHTVNIQIIAILN